MTLAATTPATNHQIAEKINTSEALVTQVLERYGLERNTVESYKNHRGDILAGLQDKILQSINEDAIKGMPVGQRVMSYGILYDKERLERGLADTGSKPLVVVVRADRIDAPQADVIEVQPDV